MHNKEASNIIIINIVFKEVPLSFRNINGDLISTRELRFRYLIINALTEDLVVIGYDHYQYLI